MLEFLGAEYKQQLKTGLNLILEIAERFFVADGQTSLRYGTGILAVAIVFGLTLD
jgi:hypothetical protein